MTGLAERMGEEVQRRRHEVLRQGSVALRGPTVTLWQVSPDGAAERLATSAPPPERGPPLDVDATLRRWSVPVAPGSRWVGCRLTTTADSGASRRCEGSRRCRLLVR